MEEKLSIRINIADRFYPLKIDRTDEEKIRKASKKINDTLFQYKQKGFTDKDDQDFLAMVALQFVTKLVEYEDMENISPVIEELKEVEKELDEYLLKEKE